MICPCIVLHGPAQLPSSETDAGTSTGRPDNQRPVGAEVGHVVFGGDGGDRKNGVKNLLVLAHYDIGTDVLSGAIGTSSTDDDIPYRLAVHHGDNEIVCSVSQDCRLFELSSDDGLKLEPSERVLQPLQDVGEQNCLVFSNDGIRLATGGEMDPKFLRNQRYAKKHNRVAGDSEDVEE